MYFDFEDYRPDTPRISTAISVREAVLLSIVAHLLVVIGYLLLPEDWWPQRDELQAEVLQQAPDERPLRFVEVLPMNDRMERPILPADASDMDRRSSTRDRPADAQEPAPFMRGNTPEMIEGGPSSPPPSPPPSPAARPEAEDPSALPSSDRGFAEAAPAPSTAAAAPPSRSLTDSLRDLQQYLRQENVNNPRGGNTDQSADIQFDSMGIDFGPWLLRFKHQVERNWLVPQVIMAHRRPEQVVIRFVVRRNGYITDVQVLRPASIPALTNSAVNSLRLSNPTAALPLEYPRDQMDIVVTYHYNMRQDPRSAP